MKDKMMNETGKFFSGILKILLLVLSCLALSFIFVWPLWKWSSASPESYTIVILVLLACGIVWLCWKSIKKNGIKHFLLTAVNIASIILGAAAFIALVINGLRVWAVVEIIAFAGAYTAVRIVLNNRKHED